ncbi:hypothetical protein HYY75_02700 [bacterium]|nr:hypothetical protein [bacterium]
MELRNDIIFVNGKALNSPDMAPIAQENSRIRYNVNPEELSKAVVSKPSAAQTVPSKNIGLLRNGQLQTVPILNVMGKVEAIVLPFSRRKTF